MTTFADLPDLLTPPRTPAAGHLTRLTQRPGSAIRTRFAAIGPAPTGDPQLLRWVTEVADLTRPDRVVWIDGSAEQATMLTDQLVQAGTFTRLTAYPNSFHCVSDPSDVARVEDRTFICSPDEADAGPTNNWMAPAAMKATMTALYDGCMRGRTMYVVPFGMGPWDAQPPMVGVEITDSEYVVVSMRVMTRVGPQALRLIEGGAPWVKALHSVGAPRNPGEQDAAWPCNQVKYISHFPAERTVWSFGSGYGGNALLGKKCYSLRLASAIARDEGWLAEHMLILKLTSPAAQVHYVAAAFPSACGKTNLAMLEPTVPGWTVQTLGDDIAWMRPGPDGRLYAMNPEFGLFGVAPGTGWSTNPNAMRAVEKGNTIFTNVALTDDGGVWWEGMTDEPPAHLIDWRGRDWTPSGLDSAGGRLDSAGSPAAHPNSRFCTPIEQVPILAPEYDSADGVPISAILFGGRRKTTVPLVTQSRDWQHGVFMGATISSETTAAATGAVGVVRRDPMAMLPFIGYDAGDYLAHWLDLGRAAQERGQADKLPAIFYVNWFRRDGNGGFLWPGFGENSRVLKWVVQRLEGEIGAHATSFGLLPEPGDLDVDGLHLAPGTVAAALAVDPAEWSAELSLIREWFDFLGTTVPAQLRAELELLTDRLATGNAVSGLVNPGPRRPSPPSGG